MANLHKTATKPYSSWAAVDSKASYPEEERRQNDLRMVMHEREALTEAAQKLNPLLDSFFDDAEQGKGIQNTTEADNLVLEISRRLGNIGGFCDGWTRERIHKMQKFLSWCLGDKAGYLLLKDALPFMVGVQVDFSKRPFRAVGLSFEALGAKFKASLKR
jgi:hypothetical protein